jgi:hypothetical protein
MARKRKVKPFRAVTAVKALARERIGVPRPGKVVADRQYKKASAEKHNATLGHLVKGDD